MTTAAEAPHHNTLTCYTNYRCRRPECTARYHAYEQARKQAQKAGLPSTDLVDATPVRRHILRLTATGIGPYSIAAATGIRPQTIHDIIRPQPSRGVGRRYRVTPQLADKILAITPDNATPLRVDATGTHRRIQALVAAGWPQQTIARHAGLSSQYLSALLQRTSIYATTAQAIAKTYNELSQQRPSRAGIDKLQSKKARNRAASHGWPTPKYWAQHPDLLDDPHFVPEASRTEQIANDAAWLLDSGLDRNQIAQRLGVSRDYIVKALRQTQEAAA